MVDKVECAVIGAGVVGLAITRAMALAGHEVILLEAKGALGTGISSRNSEVLHAGMHYAPGTLKARLCAEGSRRLRRFMEERGVSHRMVGKLIVATTADEEGKLDALMTQGEANGCHGLRLISATEARTMEPELVCTAALHSPETGILDSHGLMLAILAEAEAHGAQLALASPVRGGEVTKDGIALDVDGSEPCRIVARRVINAAGLGAQRFAHALAGLAPTKVPPLYLCKGNYFLLGGRMPFARLVYPTPTLAGLGVHYTLDLAGQGRFGPDTEWIEKEGYDVDPLRAESFYGAIRRYWPGLPDDSLRPGYAGIRPKISPPGEPKRDYLIEGPSDHGIPGLINLFGIESPGLTACLAIADYVAELAA